MLVSTSAPMVNDFESRASIRRDLGNREVSDGVARTIAAWFASPGRIGRTLAALSTSVPVELDDLLDDIRLTRAEVDPSDHTALDMLATWAIRKGGRP